MGFKNLDTYLLVYFSGHHEKIIKIITMSNKNVKQGKLIVPKNRSGAKVVSRVNL